MNYVILSEGAYSNYSPRYFAGEGLITQNELDEHGRSVGDGIIAEHRTLPECPHVQTAWYDHQTTERYNPETNEEVQTYDHRSKWIAEMVRWLQSLGFTELSSEIPEINIYYDEIPHN